MRLGIARNCMFALIAGVALIGARPKKQPPPPPPPAPIAIPQRPYPPDGSSPTLVLPLLLADGLYDSPNRNITSSQITWNLRSAYNVAALNCPEPQRSEITAGYRAFLKANSRLLTAANRGVDAEFRSKYGARFIASREKYMTYVYNHFALPPTVPAFCNAVQAMGRDARAIKPGALNAFTATALPSVEIVFDDFYKRYAKYQTELVAWNDQYLEIYTARYGAPSR